MKFPYKASRYLLYRSNSNNNNNNKVYSRLFINPKIV